MTESNRSCSTWVHWLGTPVMLDFPRNGGRNLLVHVPAPPWAITNTPSDLFLVRVCGLLLHYRRCPLVDMMLMLWSMCRNPVVSSFRTVARHAQILYFRTLVLCCAFWCVRSECRLPCCVLLRCLLKLTMMFDYVPSGAQLSTHRVHG